MRLRYIPAIGSTVEEIQENARGSDLHKEGDMCLVWVNAADLALLHQLRDLQDSQMRPVETRECDLGDTGECTLTEVDMWDLYES